MLHAGNVEAARRVLKRASELRILNSEQILSLTASLAEDWSGSIQNGQILAMSYMQPFHTCYPLTISYATFIYKLSHYFHWLAAHLFVF